MSKISLSLLAIVTAIGVCRAQALADYLSGDELKRAISGASIKAKTTKDGDGWEIRFGRSKDVEFTFADGSRRRARWQVTDKRIEFVFLQSGDRTCRMIFLAPDGRQHWQDCDTAETSSYITHPLFAAPQRSVVATAGLDDVSRKLKIETNALSDRRFSELKPSQIDLVPAKREWRIKIKLEAKRTYAVIAACAGKCSHVSLVLRAPDGSPVIESPEKRPIVVVSGEADRSGEHEIQVSVPGCPENSCPAGFQVLRLEP